MRLLHASETPIGTHEITEGLDQKRGRVNHHMQVLRRRGLVALVAAEADGEAFYVSRVGDQAAVTIFLEQTDKANSAA
jgi:predicted transcriptional regulator